MSKEPLVVGRSLVKPLAVESDKAEVCWPLVSVITAVRNGVQQIVQAIESVIAQDYPSIEHIVIDGGSTDGTQDVVARYRDRLAYFVSEPDGGIADAWNKGLQVARGRYIAFLNADDFYLPSFIRRCMEVSADAPNEVLFGRTVVIGSNGESEGVVDKGFDPDRLASGFGFRHPSCVTRRELFETAGHFDPAVRIACDTDFLLRCVKLGAEFRRGKGVVCMRRGGVSDRHWRRAALEHLDCVERHGLASRASLRIHRWSVPLRVINRKWRLMTLARHLKTQTYFVGLRLLNVLHGLLPFVARPALYGLCGFAVNRSATLQGGVRFFHIGKLVVGADSVVNRGVYLDNRVGIRIGSRVSIAHDVKIYSLGHDIHDDLFALKGRPVVICDSVVIFAGAMIMPGVTLGEGSVVMAGAVVTADVAPFEVVGGNPARPIAQRDSTPAYVLKRRYWFAH